MSGAGPKDLLRLEYAREPDLFAVRRTAREVAAAAGLEVQDQVRLATALSEVGREVLGSGPAAVWFAIDPAGPSLIVTVEVPGGREPAAGAAAVTSGLAAARRLIEAVDVEEAADGVRVRLAKRLPRGLPPDDGWLTQVRERMAGLAPGTPLDELGAQNSELVATLDQLTARQQDLIRVNAELEETNRGVLAMYAQLSQELEDTNRGVVALYAELDEKGRQLVEANEAKTRFLRNVSHELRTPVNSILGLSDLLADGTLDGDQRVQVSYLRGAGRSLLNLVNELLDLARAESGRQEVRIAEIDLSRLLGELRGTLRPVAQAQDIDLEIVEPGVGPLHTDPELLSRVLRNLLTNALKFTPAGGRVRLGVTLEGAEQIRFDVADTGIGIPAEYHQRVFDEFFQVSGPLQQPRAGTGLGLPYARRVAETLGGTLELVSEPGVGSTFTLLLPARPDEQRPELADLQIGHALVVDDDAAFRQVIRGMMQGVATRVSEASDGRAALDLLRELPVDVVLLDLRMPVLDGAGTLAEMRADPQLRDLPVILLTSVDIDADVRRASEPAAALLAKSQVTRHRLLCVLDDVLTERSPGGAGAGR